MNFEHQLQLLFPHPANCPCCGVTSTLQEETQGYRIYCNGCSISTPWYASSKAAVVTWNMRTRPKGYVQVPELKIDEELMQNAVNVLSAMKPKAAANLVQQVIQKAIMMVTAESIINVSKSNFQ